MNEEMMKKAIEESRKNSENNYQAGGPFGAVIVKDGEIISTGHNNVIASEDPTAHAEINAIRKAALKLNNYDLSGCTLYVNAEPCPMCLSAAIWANIKDIYFANTAEQAGKIGFRDDMIYDFIKSDKKNKNILNMERIESKEAMEVFDEFENNPDKIMY